jgi:hypothetical protein
MDPDRFLANARSALERLEPQLVPDAIQRGAILVDLRPEFRRRTKSGPRSLSFERSATHLDPNAS